MLQRRHGKRRRAAGGDRDHNVVRREPRSIDLSGGVGDVVFGAFDACGKCALPTGDDETQPLLGPGESRGQLRSVLYGDPARGAGANIDQAPAIAERFVCRVGRRGDGGERAPYSGDRGELALPHRFHRRRQRPSVEISKARVDVFGGHACDPFLVTDLKGGTWEPVRVQLPHTTATRPRRHPEQRAGDHITNRKCRRPRRSVVSQAAMAPESPLTRESRSIPCRQEHIEQIANGIGCAFDNATADRIALTGMPKRETDHEQASKFRV